MKQFDIIRTVEFNQWLESLDGKTRVRVLARLDMVSLGHIGFHKKFDGLIELKWKNGTRVYSFMWGNAMVIALNGGNKNGQQKDINKAKKIRNEYLDGTRSF